MKRPSLFAGLLLLLVLTLSCKDKDEQYARPPWLSGKIYEQLSKRTELSTFKECVDRHSEYKEILAKTNLLTVFAPNNAAFEEFFANNPYGYKSVADMPRSYVRGLVEHHIVFMAWNTDQLALTDGEGKIDPDDPDRSEPTGFKKRTAFQDSIYEIRVFDDDIQPAIVRSGGTSSRKVHNAGYKYMPIFYQSYFQLMEITSDDYAFYYNRPFDPATLYYGPAQLVPDNGDVKNVNIPAENGFVHIIDKVVPPVPNMEQRLLASQGQPNSYVDFLDLIRSYPIIVYDDYKTREQPGYEDGTADDIFFVMYNTRIFALQLGLEQIVGGVPGDDNMVLYHTLFAPTDQAFDKLIDEITGYPNWKNYAELPDAVKQILINSYTRYGSTYLKDLEKGITNVEGDSLFGGFGNVGLDNVVDKEILSNGMFIGLNEPIVPRAFSSVAGPVYLRPEYNKYRLALEKIGLFATLKNTTQDYTLCVINDLTFDLDSFMIVEALKDNDLRYGYKLQYYDRNDETEPKLMSYQRADLNLFMNMVLEGQVQGEADVEFVKTLAGNYAIFEKQPDGTTTLQGSDLSMRGISSKDTIIYPEKLDFDADNGVIYDLSAYLNFSSTSRLYGTISTMGASDKDNQDNIVRYGFFDLLVKADLVDVVKAEFKFLTDGNFYTVFIPSVDVLAKYEEIEGIKLHQLPKDELAQLLKYHFIQGSLLFTDGKAPNGDYKTMRISDKSTEFNTVYSRLGINSIADELSILDKNDMPYAYINPVKGRTNVMTYNSKSSSSDDALYIPHYTSGVVHMVDQVLVYEEE